MIIVLNVHHQISLWNFIWFPSYSRCNLSQSGCCVSSGKNSRTSEAMNYFSRLNIIFFVLQKVATTTELGGKSVKNAFKAINIGSYQEIFPSFYPLPMMDRSGLDQMTDSSGLCLQDLVGSNNNNSSNGNIPTSQSNSNDHLHNHHHHHNLHDGTTVSVSSAISNLMSPGVGSLGSGLTTGLSHLHHSTHPDLSGHHHHHHITSPHTPSVLHEPLEKLKCKLMKTFLFAISAIHHEANNEIGYDCVYNYELTSNRITFASNKQIVLWRLIFNLLLMNPRRNARNNGSSSARERDVEMIVL